MEMSLRRREFLRMALTGVGFATVGALPVLDLRALAAAEEAPLSRAQQTLKEAILEHATARDNPWLIMHGIRAMGKEFSLQGSSAVEYLCSHFLREKSVNGKAYLHFSIDDEAHTNAFLSEAALDVGITTKYPFHWNGRRYTIGDLVASAKALLVFDPASFDKNDLAWSLLAFAHTTVPQQDTWVNAYSKPVRFSQVVEFGMTTLEEATQQLRATVRQGTMPTEKDWIHNFTCGGTHLIYGLATCVRFGYKQRALSERMKSQFDLLVWRLEADPYLIDRHYEQAVGQYPAELARIYLLDAKLKFLGHAFEIINYVRLFRLFSPTAAQERAIMRGQQALASVIDAIGREGIGKFAGNKALFNLLVGDACHAYHGLHMVRGVNQA